LKDVQKGLHLIQASYLYITRNLEKDINSSFAQSL